MRKAIVIGILGLALTSEGAAAQTAVEQAQILRDFEQSVAAIDAATPAPKVFTLPVAMVFRQLIGLALAGPVGGPEFPQRLAEALPLLPAPLEYRLVFNDLVIRDTRRGVIIAVLRDAFGAVMTR